jgi:hypothetical protein
MRASGRWRRNNFAPRLVENAVKHGALARKNGGSVEVRAEVVDAKRLVCTVEDNGHPARGGPLMSRLPPDLAPVSDSWLFVATIPPLAGSARRPAAGFPTLPGTKGEQHDPLCIRRFLPGKPRSFRARASAWN